MNTISHWCYRSYPIPEKPSLTSADVTVILPTIHNVFEELRKPLLSILACSPAELILVTPIDKFVGLQKLADSLGHGNIRVIPTPVANKRLQVCEALPKVKTKITILADDDVEWPSTMMPWLLAPFENPRMGGVVTCQRVKRVWDGPLSVRIFNWLGAAYIERRNFEISATHNMDGGTSCMSGRTGAYRTEILASHDFLEGFKTEKWGKYTLNADDDNFVTRWLVNHQWQTWVQYDPECELETTLENGTKFLYQCSRWARSNWRSNYTSLFVERYVLRLVTDRLVKPMVLFTDSTCPDNNRGAPMPCTWQLSRLSRSWSTLCFSYPAGGQLRTGTRMRGGARSGPSSSSCLASPR